VTLLRSVADVVVEQAMFVSIGVSGVGFFLGGSSLLTLKASYMILALEALRRV